MTLVGILSGFGVVYGLLTSKRLDGWTAVFLATTVATSVTGFFLRDRFLSSHAFGILSLLVLPVAIYALDARKLEGSWRWIYVISAMTALYLNVFVLVVQLFLKVPSLNALDPTQSGPPFLAAQSAVLALFMVLTWIAARRFHLEQPRLA